MGQIILEIVFFFFLVLLLRKKEQYQIVKNMALESHRLGLEFLFEYAIIVYLGRVKI